MLYRSYRSVRYRYRCCTDTGTNSGTDVHTGTGGTGFDVVPNLPKCPVPVLMDRTYRRVGTDMKVCTELTEVFGTGIDAVPNLPKCPVPVLMDRTYRSVRYRYKSLYRYRRYRYPCRAELTEVCGTVIDVVLNLLKWYRCRTELTYQSVQYR